MWFRFGRKHNVQIYQALRPDLDTLGPDDRLTAQDVIDTLFPPQEALHLLDYLTCHPELGSEHRMVSVHHPGYLALHRRLWSGEAYELHPYSDCENSWVNGVDFPVVNASMAGIGQVLN